VTPLELGFALTLGLASGLHCLQMCGPIALAVGPGRAALLYNAGRILTYTFLGLLAGTLGKALMFLGGPATVLSGAAMIVAGMALLLPSKSLIAIRPRGRFARLSGALLRAGRNRFLFGIVLGFLPCGLVYAALLKAMHAAGPIAGAVTMLCYGLGTSVALLSIGYAGAFCGRWMQRIAPFGIMLAGAVLVWRGITGTPHCHG
jgi:uncharacterized protein